MDEHLQHDAFDDERRAVVAVPISSSKRSPRFASAPPRVSNGSSRFVRSSSSRSSHDSGTSMVRQCERGAVKTFECASPAGLNVTVRAPQASVRDA